MTQIPTKAEYVKKLEWAVWYSQENLQPYYREKWIKLEPVLTGFVEGAGIYTDLGSYIPAFYEWEKLRALAISIQESLKGNLHRLARTGIVKVPKSGPGFVDANDISSMQFAVKGRLIVMALEGKPYSQLMRHNTIESQFNSALASYLVSSGIVAGQIRKCPSCGRIFLMKRKPSPGLSFYCSPKCSRRAASRSYRQGRGRKLEPKERE